MGLVEVVQVYSTIDRHFIAAGEEDSKHYVSRVLNLPHSYHEQVSDNLWFSDALAGCFKREIADKRKIKNITGLVVQGFGLYSITEYIEDEEQDFEIDYEVDSEFEYKYLFCAENPAVALTDILGLSVGPLEKRMDLTIEPVENSLIFTAEAVYRFSEEIEKQKILEN